MRVIDFFSFRLKLFLMILMIVLISHVSFSQEVDSLKMQALIDSAVKAAIDTSRSTVVPDTTVRTLHEDPDSSEHKIVVGDKVYTPDIVFLKNGDRITGKILSFEQGRLSIDGQGPGIVSIKWHKISTINGGSRTFKVEDVNGVIYYGRMEFSKDTGEVIVQGDMKYGVMLENIIRIFPLESEWYRGFKGNIAAGISYTKSSEIVQANVDYDLYYVIKKWRIMNDFAFLSTSTNREDPSLRIETNLQGLYKLHKKWLLSELIAFNRNDELGIKSRVSFGVGGGNSIVQTDRQRFLFLTGVLVNLERDIESNGTISNLEWPFTIQHTIYSFAKPNLTSSTSITSYVGITEKGRYRADANADFTWEFIANLKLKLTFYYNFDNKLVEGKLSKQDYGTVLSLEVRLK